MKLAEENMHLSYNEILFAAGIDDLGRPIFVSCQVIILR